MLRRIAAALVAATGIAVIALADAPMIRYASVALGQQVCYANQFENLPPHIDVAIFGSSRARTGIRPDDIQAASGGQFQEVYNLAVPGVNIVRSLVTFEEILDSGRTVSAIIVESDIDLVRRSIARRWTWEQASAGRATWLELVTHSPRFIADNRLPDPRLILQGMRTKLNQALLIATSGLAWDVLTHRRDEAPRVCDVPNFDRTAPGLAMLRAAQEQRVRTRFVHPETDYDTVFNRRRSNRATAELQFIARLRERAQSAGVQFIVVRPQAFAEPVLHPRVVAQLQRLIPEYRYPPEPLVRRLNWMHYDNHHLDWDGARLYSAWITEQILSERASAAQSQEPRQ